MKITVSQLSSSEGIVSPSFYGETTEGGYVYIHQKNGWIRVKYMAASEVLPRSNSTVYYEYRPDVSLATLSIEEIDDALPNYISLPSEFQEFSSSVQEAMWTVWHGVFYPSYPNENRLDEINVSTFFQGMPELSDDEWEEFASARIVAEASTNGWEDENVARKRLGDDVYEAFVDDDLSTTDKINVFFG